MKKFKIAIVGATGAVGREMLRCVFQFNFPFESIKLLASARSAGKEIEFEGHKFVVEELTENSFEGVEVAFWSAGGSISEKYMKYAVEAGCVNIDNTSHFRMDPNVPLVVPEVNGEALVNHHGIISCPNCTTIMMCSALTRLNDEFDIERIVVSTYQAVSGSGVKGVEDLEKGMNGNPTGFYPHQISYNCLPHIDSFTENGYTKEEMKMVNETRKILHNDEMRVTATTVRVPVFDCHSESINIEFEKPFEMDDLLETLKNAPGVVLQNNSEANEYPLAVDVAGHDEVYIGRVRRDDSVESGVNIWVVADNIRKGAATNAVQIAEEIIKNMQ